MKYKLLRFARQLGLMLLAAKKFIIIGLVAVAGFFKKIFGGKSK